MTSRYKKAGYAAAAVLGLFAGAAGIAAAATGGTDPAPAPSVSQTDEADDGVNCEDGIDTATGNECDGGPAAAHAEEATEARDGEDEADEADDGIDHQFEGEEVGENGNSVADADETQEHDD